MSGLPPVHSITVQDCVTIIYDTNYSRNYYTDYDNYSRICDSVLPGLKIPSDILFVTDPHPVPTRDERFFYQ